MQYNILELAKFITSESVFISDADSIIKYVALDSRNISFAKNALFFALKGRRLNAHSFIKEAYLKGVRNFIISEKIDYKAFPTANFIVVLNVIDALQSFARFHRTHFSLPVIGITGSNGKTIVKEWLYQLLVDDYFIVRSPRSYNSQIGVPLSVLEIKEQHDLAIFEAGISQPDEMQRLASIIQCNIGILTNIGDAHNEGFKSRTEKITEKLKLFNNCDILIYCKDYFEKEIDVPTNTAFFTWSKKQKEVNLYILENKFTSIKKTHLKGYFQDKEIEIFIPFTDDASIENAIHCWCVMLYLGYDDMTIQQRMNHLQPVALRLELKTGINNCLIINDSYSLDMTSLTLALDFMSQQSQHNNKTLLLSDVLQSGLSSEILYQQIAQLLQQQQINKLIAIGSDIEIIGNFISPTIEFQYYKSVTDFLAKAKLQSFQNETILLKGARVFEFERIAELLELKAHRTVLEINLDALRHNLAAYTRRLSKNTKILF